MTQNIHVTVDKFLVHAFELKLIGIYDTVNQVFSDK